MGKKFVKLVRNSSFSEIYVREEPFSPKWEFITAESGITLWLEERILERLWSETSDIVNGEEVTITYFRVLK